MIRNKIELASLGIYIENDKRHGQIMKKSTKKQSIDFERFVEIISNEEANEKMFFIKQNKYMPRKERRIL